MYLVRRTDIGAVQDCFLPAILQLVPRHAVVRHHGQVVPGASLVVERRPDVDSSGVGVDREEVGVIGLSRETIVQVSVNAEVAVCRFHLYTVIQVYFTIIILGRIACIV